VAQKTVSGVAGVLRGLIADSAPDPQAQPPLSDRMSSEDQVSAPARLAPNRTTARARMGRPPGRIPGQQPPREKLTLRVDAGLTAAYRDWSWDARCQLGELVERAMRDYLANRRQPR
jgi:hypothetical protein